MPDSNDPKANVEDAQVPTGGLTPGRALTQLAIAGAVVAAVAVFVRPHSPFVDKLFTTVENVELFGSGLDCGSESAQGLALQIARDNSPLKKMDASSASPESKSRIEDAMGICDIGFYKNVTEKLGVKPELLKDAQGSPTCNKLVLGPRYNFTPEGRQVEQIRAACVGIYEDQVRNCRASMQGAADADFAKAAEAASYSLETVRITSKDEATHKLTCAASLQAVLPGDWGNLQREVSFTVEKTTKGELYVTVSGLE